MALADGASTGLNVYKRVSGEVINGELTASIAVQQGDAVILSMAQFHDGATIHRQRLNVTDNQDLDWNTDDWGLNNTSPQSAGGCFKALAKASGTLEITLSEAVQDTEFSVCFALSVQEGPDQGTPWGTGALAHIGSSVDDPSVTLGHSTGIDRAVVYVGISTQGASADSGLTIAGWTVDAVQPNDTGLCGFIQAHREVLNAGDVTAAFTTGTPPVGGAVAFFSVVRPSIAGGGGMLNPMTADFVIDAQAVTGAGLDSIAGTTGWEGEVLDAPGSADRLFGAKIASFSGYAMPAEISGTVTAKAPISSTRAAGSAIRGVLRNGTYQTGVLAGVLSATSGGGGGGGGSSVKPVGFPSYPGELTFNDDFDGGLANWLLSSWDPSSKNSGGTFDNFDVANSELRIWPKDGNDGGNPLFATTLWTRGVFSQLYGYFEARIKFPVGAVWPGWWLYSDGGMDEADIAEAYGMPASAYWGSSDYLLTRYGATLHRGGGVGVPGGTSAGPAKSALAGANLSSGFHVYGMKWDPSGANFYLDGSPMDVGGENPQQATGNGRINLALSRPMFLLLDLAYTNRASPANITPRGPSNAMRVDYVRAWA